MSNIKKNLIKSILFFTAIILTIFSLYLSILVYHIKISDSEKIIKEKNEAIVYLINNLFVKIKNYINLLSNDKRIIDFSLLTPKSKREVLSIYKKLKNIDPDINYLYSGYENGKFLINNYIPPKGYDPRVRPWYKAALKTAPKISTGVPYKDINTKEWLVSFSKVLLNGNNKITGVLSADISLTKIVNLLKQETFVKCFVLNKKGNIIIHSDTSLLNKNYMENKKLFSKNKITYLRSINSLGWTIVTEIDKNELVAPIIFQILITNLIVLMIAILFGWSLSVSFSKKFVTPIIGLKNRVEAIIENQLYHKDDFKYPNNEIGTIAQKIEKLTQNELYKKNKQLTELSQTDQLTKLYNRRFILKALEDEFNRAKRYKTIFSVILFDIDHFKQVNDVFGHNAGDDVLREISQLINNIVRTTDKVSRWGGEEFLILCCETEGEKAKLLAEKLRKNVEKHNFPIDRQVTISGGVSAFNNEINITELIEKADEKLYQAKNSGRNKIIY